MSAQRHIAVTGANGGIGKATAQALLADGHRVFLLCRSEARGEAARAELSAATGRDDVVLIRMDLTSFASVRAGAAELVEKAGGRLDVLVNNAGVAFSERQLTGDGHELVLQVNHLSHFLLTHLLKDALRASDDPRVVHVSSDGHRQVRRIDLDDLGLAHGRYGVFKQYSRTKLMNVWFNRELARRWAAEGVTSAAVHPGMVKSDITGGGDTSPLIAWGWNLLKPIMRSAEKGAETSVWLATAAEPRGKSGRYWHDCAEAKVSRLGARDDLAEGLWTRSEQLCGLA